LVLTGDREIRRLNRRYLNHDRATDVLAFPPLPSALGKLPLIGDVMVSVERAQAAGPGYGNQWDEELLLYLCHGVLHLRGWRDSTPAEKAGMDRKQTATLLKVLGKKWRSKNRMPLF